MKRIASVTLALALCACSHTRTSQPAGDDLYRALGGEAGVVAIVERFLFNLADDERINERFVDTNILRFREKMIEHMCQLTGGPCAYTGDTMMRTHAGMGIDHADFNAVVEALIEAMESLDVPTGPQNRLLALLAPMHTDIIERPADHARF